ncbi:hypothetical protein ACWDHW_45405 [Streptomyces melanosporofaciens]|uniref:hypothetical protein n=1 Tax=unclassified Streptomyces TaxID=2593676 RepID=UPI0036880903
MTPDMRFPAPHAAGAGKTRDTIDTLHSEAQLRYLEGPSPFVRQYITQRNRPKADRILGSAPRSRSTSAA